MLHVAARERLFCPIYCLMPDHLHLVWMGICRQTDQLRAMAFLRTHLEPALAPYCFQHQPHDHVLGEKERTGGAFEAICSYIAANPVRDELVPKAEDWRFSGAVVPGYPTLNPFQPDYWEKFWRIHSKQREAQL